MKNWSEPMVLSITILIFMFVAVLPSVVILRGADAEEDNARRRKERGIQTTPGRRTILAMKGELLVLTTNARKKSTGDRIVGVVELLVATVFARTSTILKA